MHDLFSDRARRVVVQGRWALSTLTDRVEHAARERAAALTDDRGAQAAEYAMLGGVSAAACGGLVTILSRTDVLERIVSAVIDSLVDVVGSWF